MKERVLTPEILDSLPAEDPKARRSRRDLALINRLMGNYAWLARRMEAPRLEGPRAWVEIGAGDGPLRNVLSPSALERLSVAGVDLASRPEAWPLNWAWHRGDLFEVLRDLEPPATSVGLAANLFLHHFQDSQLRELGALINACFARALFVEPARYPVFRTLGYGLFPFVNGVTRHDLQASVSAGFRPGELGPTLGLDASWQWRESVTTLGAYRFEAWKD